jgi:hypothetical protein
MDFCNVLGGNLDVVINSNVLENTNASGRIPMPNDPRPRTRDIITTVTAPDMMKRLVRD